MQSTDPETLVRHLAALDSLLRAAGWVRGPQVWQAVSDLLLLRASRGQLPDTGEEWAAILGPILCQTPEEQARFPSLCALWLTGTPLAPEVRLSSPMQARVAHWRARLQRSRRRGLGVGVLLLLTAFGGGLWRVQQLDPQVVPPPKRDPPAHTTGPTAKLDGKIPLDNWAPPRLLPETDELPSTWRKELPRWGYALSASPWAFALLYVLWRYWPRRLLEQARPQGDSLLSSLPFNPPQPVFGGARPERSLRELNATRWIPSRQLDVEATVIATANAGGYAQPRYRWRRHVPQYIVLVRSVHREDQQAALAEELVQRFLDNGLAVQAFRFREDPRWLIPWGRERVQTPSLTHLASEYAEASLIVISDDSIVLDPLTGAPRPWLTGLLDWPKRVWLTLGSQPPATQILWARDFCVLPLTRDYLGQLADWIRAIEPQAPAPILRDQALPAPLRERPERWLHPHPPADTPLLGLVGALRDYLGVDGLRLLRAIAVYPEPRWALTQALDFFLFPTANEETGREDRLFRLSRLPWLQYAYLPGYLREALFASIPTADYERISGVWGTLLGTLTDRNESGRLSLPVAVPKKRRLRQLLADLRRASGPDAALRDPIFNTVLLGRPLRPWQFRLRAGLRRFLPRALWQVDLRPLLITIGTAGVASLMAYVLWQHRGQDALRAVWQARLRSDNAHWQVAIQTTPETAALGQTLLRQLGALGYQVKASEITQGEAAKVNTLSFPPNAQDAAAILAEHIQYASYGARLERTAMSGSSEVMSLTLSQTLTANAVFHDTLLATDSTTAPFAVFHDVIKSERPAKADTPGPAMVVLPGGRFAMGCSAGDKSCAKSELPVHPVNISPFAIGRTEVTFEDYERFAQATGQKSPDDSKWGRGLRPVINLTWDDARKYAEWLSQRTGQRYRLPTEAEWEYAARGGSTDIFPWGNSEDDTGLFAWFYKNSETRTHPVAGKRPNRFGVYDTAGNVDEWTLDCYHDNYEQAPADGSAWQGILAADCRPVVRGGSWVDGPRVLRSSIRVRDRRGGAGVYLGFRLARDL